MDRSNYVIRNVHMSKVHVTKYTAEAVVKKSGLAPSYSNLSLIVALCRHKLKSWVVIEEIRYNIFVLNLTIDCGIYTKLFI